MRIETSLTGVSIVESPFHFGHKLVVLQAPAGDGEEAGGRLRDKALEDKVGTETLDEVDDEVDVFIGREEVEIGRIRGIFGSHASTLSWSWWSLSRVKGRSERTVASWSIASPLSPGSPRMR